MSYSPERSRKKHGKSTLVHAGNVTSTYIALKCGTFNRRAVAVSRQITDKPGGEGDTSFANSSLMARNEIIDYAYHK